MNRTILLLVDPSPEVRKQLVSVLALVPKMHLETCTAERIAAESRRCQPHVWLLTDPARSLSADGASAMVAERCVSLTLDASQDALMTALRAGVQHHFVLPAQASSFAQWLRHQDGGRSSTERASARRSPALIAESPSMQRLLSLLERISASPATVFLTGASGVGKEILAREIHRRSPRRDAAFEAVNCAALPETMLEAMLFGHERGAFTGASEARPGKFRSADGGTLLLDEITEMPLGLQAKLLRVLQEQEVEPLGARRPKPVDVRVLATSNRPPRLAVQEGALREDLYYRLNVFPLHVPALRDRPEDLLPLAAAFAAELSNGRTTRLSEAAAQRLRAHDWPGNVRELRNLIERSCLLCGAEELDAADLMFEDDWLSVNAPEVSFGASVDNSTLDLGARLQQQEIRVILDTLASVGGDRQETASRLGISPRTLRYKLARLRDAGVRIPSP